MKETKLTILLNNVEVTDREALIMDYYSNQDSSIFKASDCTYQVFYSSEFEDELYDLAKGMAENLIDDLSELVLSRHSKNNNYFASMLCTLDLTSCMEAILPDVSLGDWEMKNNATCITCEYNSYIFKLNE